MTYTIYLYKFLGKIAKYINITKIKPMIRADYDTEIKFTKTKESHLLDRFYTSRD